MVVEMVTMEKVQLENKGNSVFSQCLLSIKGIFGLQIPLLIESACFSSIQTFHIIKFVTRQGLKGLTD